MNCSLLHKLIKYPILGAAYASLAITMPALAQTDDEEAFALEEIIVTGRKREESLQEVPISISVVGQNELAELNVLRQGDLADLIPGFHYNQGVGAAEDRNAALPSIRGIGSTELASNRSKVATFIDGMPILGSVGAINIGGATQVEVYRGPQSAAFGRSTFAGAINYVTVDPGDTFEGSAGLNWSNDGTRIISGSFGGPLTDTLGFHVSANIEDSESPDPDLYTYSDGVEALTETGENISARLVFTPNDKLKVKVGYARDTTDDGPRSDFYASAESSFECYNSLELFNVRGNVGPPNNVGIDGVNECELEVHPDTVLELLADYPRYFENNPEVLTGLADSLRSQVDGPVDGYLGLTVEEQLEIIYNGFSVNHDDVGSDSERDRFTSQFEYLLDDGSGLQLSLMRSTEDQLRTFSRVAEQNPDLNIYWDPDAQLYYDFTATTPGMGADLGGTMGQNGRRVPTISETEIEENYAEIRWASPDAERLKWVVGASYYDYEYVLDNYTTPGFNNLADGTADLLVQLYEASEFADSGGIVQPSSVQSEVTTNTAVFFNATYDFTETLTGSIEGRYASDEVGAILVSPDQTLEDEVTTKTFTPRLALNWTPSEDTTYYIQYSQGVNPAGINASMLDPLLRATLDEGIPVDLDPTDADTTLTLVPANANFSSSDYTSYDEEELTNYEIGFKGTVLDGRLAYAGAVYYMEWDNALENIALDWDYEYADNEFTDVPTLVTDVDPTGPAGVYYVPENQNTSVNNVLTNTGLADTMGIEIQASYRINDNWSINANGALMKTEFTDYCSEDDYLGFANEIGVYAELEESTSEGGNPCWVLDGLEVANQPSFNLTIIPRYRTQLANGVNLTASATVRHRGKYFNEFSNTTETASMTRLNLNFGLSRDAWSGTLYIDNVLDDKGLEPRGATNVARFDALNGPEAEIPAEYQYDGAEVPGGPWGSWRFNRNVGRTFGMRVNYNF